MAKEILIIDFNTVLFFRRWANAKVVIGGQPQVLTSASSELPPVAAAMVNQNRKDDIDNGKIAWEALVIRQGKAETDQEYESRLAKKWAVWENRQRKRVNRWADEVAAARWFDLE